MPGMNSSAKIFQRALGAPVQRRPGRVEHVAEMAVEFGVLLLGHLGLRLAPQRGALVGGQVLAVARDGDRHGDVVGPFAHDRSPAGSARGYSSASALRCSTTSVPASSRVAGAMVKSPRAVGGPGPGLLGAGLARGDLDPVGDHEGGVEADAELADQARAGPRAWPPPASAPKARVPERAMVPRLSISSSRVMPMPSSAISRVRAGLSGTMRTLAPSGGARAGSVERLEAAAVHRVGGVGDQFAQENFALGIERMHHQVEQPPDLGAEAVAFIPGSCGLNGLSRHFDLLLARGHIGHRSRAVSIAFRRGLSSDPLAFRRGEP